MDRSSRLRSGTFDWVSILPPRCSRKVRSLTLLSVTPSMADSACDDRLGVLGVPRRAGDVDPQPLMAVRGDVQRGDGPARLLDGVGELADRPAARGTSSRTVIE